MFATGSGAILTIFKVWNEISGRRIRRGADKSCVQTTFYSRKGSSSLPVLGKDPSRYFLGGRAAGHLLGDDQLASGWPERR
jgi:hypothetical protein